MTGNSAQAGPGALSGGDLVVIAPESLIAETIADFDILVRFRAEADTVLYREKHLPIQAAELERLKESQVHAVYVTAADESRYLSYVAENLREVLNNETLSIERRSSLLYRCATGLMQEVMSEPRAKGLLEKTISVANEAADFVANKGAAFEQLLKVASFDYYTYTHSMNVFMFSVALAQRTCIDDPDELRAFGQAVLLHDIGKSMVGEDVVNWRGPLDDDQWRRMKMHPVHGFDILVDQGFLCERGLKVVRHHHEKIGGGGYPDNLKGDRIGPWVRVTTICDIFDALTTKRSYKDALDTFPALTMMRDKMMADLDPALFQTFVKLMGEQA
jgi:HD-GYP domain-containing protein (c-di-GMP phosphodiesterase class II)